MTASLRLRAGLVSILLLAVFLGAWHIATRGSAPVATMSPEYAKLMGLTATQGTSAMPGRSMSAPSCGTICAGRSMTTGRTTRGWASSSAIRSRA